MGKHRKQKRQGKAYNFPPADPRPQSLPDEKELLSWCELKHQPRPQPVYPEVDFYLLIVVSNKGYPSQRYFRAEENSEQMVSAIGENMVRNENLEGKQATYWVLATDGVRIWEPGETKFYGVTEVLSLRDKQLLERVAS